MFKFLFKILKDFYNIYFNSADSLTGFAFIVHPRDYGDVVNNVRFLRFL